MLNCKKWACKLGIEARLNIISQHIIKWIKLTSQN
jgi:hypothetical protein